jgi:hypothetical protein
MSQFEPHHPTGRRPSAVSWGLRNLLDVLERRGADALAVRHAAGLDEGTLDDPDSRVDSGRGYRAWEAAVALTGEPDLGLVVAGTQPPGAFDLLEYAFRASSTLGRALRGRYAAVTLMSAGVAPFAPVSTARHCR